MKRFLTVLLRSTMQRRTGQLSNIGLGFEKVARWTSFLARDIRANSAHSVSAAKQIVWPISPRNRWLIDVGANCGETIPYYLARGFRVVAVEANPALAQKIASDFSEPIAAGSLVVLNCCIAPTDEEYIDLHINDDNDQLTTASLVDASAPGYSSIRVPARRIGTLQCYDPLAVKIDIEGLDALVLKDMLDSQFFPSYISVEAHSPDVLCYLVAAGYREFKIVEGKYVGSPRFEQIVDSSGHSDTMRFGRHAAGPIGEDVPGPWLTLTEAFEYLAEFGFGWKDIHARRS